MQRTNLDITPAQILLGAEKHRYRHNAALFTGYAIPCWSHRTLAAHYLAFCARSCFILAVQVVAPLSTAMSVKNKGVDMRLGFCTIAGTVAVASGSRHTRAPICIDKKNADKKKIRKIQNTRNHRCNLLNVSTAAYLCLARRPPGCSIHFLSPYAAVQGTNIRTFGLICPFLSA